MTRTLAYGLVGLLGVSLASTAAAKEPLSAAAKRGNELGAPGVGGRVPAQVAGGSAAAGAPVSGSAEGTIEATSAPKDEGAKAIVPEEAVKPERNPFAGSVIVLDQSMTTNSFSKGSQLSYSPLYEWWISPRVYYGLTEHIKFGARFDFFKEMFTNHEATTQKQEWRTGDPWLTAAYGGKPTFLNRHEKSRWSVGVTVRPPLSKESRANGQYLAAGPNGAFTWGFDVAGKRSTFFPSGSLGVSASFSHAFTRATTPTKSGFDLKAQDTSGNATLVDDVRSGTLVGNTLLYAINGDIDILENLSLSASMIWIDQFSYRPTEIDGLARRDDDTRFRQLTWLLTSLEYQPLKELSVGVGYYNLANSIAPDGGRRSVLWSPDARVFLSITGHLDAIYDRAFKKKEKSESADPVRGAVASR